MTPCNFDMIRKIILLINIMCRTSPGFAGVLRRRALLTTVDTSESISLPESHRDLCGAGLDSLPSSSVSLSLLVGGKLDSSLSGGGSTLTSLLNTPIMLTSRKSSIYVNGWVKVRRILLFLCLTFTDPSDSDRFPFNLLSVFTSPLVHFKSDGDRDFFLGFRLLLHRFCLLDSRAVCIVVALMISETRNENNYQIYYFIFQMSLFLNQLCRLNIMTL